MVRVLLHLEGHLCFVRDIVKVEDPLEIVVGQRMIVAFDLVPKTAS